MHIGIIGGGQLGRMLALAGYPLGFTFCGLEPTPHSPMGQVAPQIQAAYDDAAGLDALVRGSGTPADVITYEFENVPVAVARHLEKRVPVYPPPQALEVSQDRWHEKSFFKQWDIPTPAFAKVDGADDLDAAIEKIGGLPCVLKTRRLGYDGKGQWVLRSAEDVSSAREDIRNAAAPAGYIVEAWVPFVRELSILAVRSAVGELAFYPLVQNTHREGILRLSLVPAQDSPDALAQTYATRLLNALDYVGVLAIEFFEKDGPDGRQLIANEMAPRVHNSGHWTQDGAITSQFENHLRAIAGLPLGATDVRGFAAMVNLIGTVPETEAVLKIPGAHLHLYGKDPRPGRKLGHINVVADDAATLQARVAQIQALL